MRTGTGQLTYLIGKKGNIVVYLCRWSPAGLYYFEVVRETKSKDSLWTNCEVLKRTFPTYPLKALNKLLPTETYRNLVFKKVDELLLKYGEGEVTK